MWHREQKDRSAKGNRRLTARLVQTLGAMIEPELNVEGWRSCGVTVGGRICPSPVIVPALMNEWANKVKAGEFEPDQAYLAFEEIHRSVTATAGPARSFTTAAEQTG